MALRLIKKDDPVEIGSLNIVIYGQPGIGKTTYAFTAKNPIMLDFDGGSYRAVNRMDALKADAWSDIEHMDQSLFEGHDTVIIDTVGRAVDLLERHVWQQEPKNRSGNTLSLKGYGQLKSQFIAWMKRLSGGTRDIVLTAHAKEESKNDSTVMRLDITGGSRDEVYKIADMMGEMSISDKRRTINWSPTEASYGKNPGQLDAAEIRDPGLEPDALAKAIESTKLKLKQKSEESKLETTRLNNVAASFATAVDEGRPAEWWTEEAMKLVSSKSPPQDKALLNRAARTAGYKWSREDRCYVGMDS